MDARFDRRELLGDRQLEGPNMGNKKIQPALKTGPEVQCLGNVFLGCLAVFALTDMLRMRGA